MASASGMGSTGRSLVVTALTLALLVSLASSTYWDDRQRFVDEEASRAVGSRINMTSQEEELNEVLMVNKRKELSDGLGGVATFLPARHFFDSKADMEKSEVFRFIKDLPKGAVLHGHDTSMVSLGYVVSNLTYRDNLYACISQGPWAAENASLVRLRFSAGGPPKEEADCVWQTLRDLRMRNGQEAIDQWLSHELSLLTKNPSEKYPNVDVVWDYFNHVFERIDGLITYKPVFVDYLKQVLAELRDDNIIYLEIRGTLQKLYDTEGNQWEGSDVLQIYKEVTDEFVKENPEDFFGVRFIYGPIRGVNDSTFDEDLRTVVDLLSKFPSFLAGFDLVGQEDKGRPLIDFVDRLLSLPPSLKFYFHAGETNWEGLTDMNLIDAVLLNTTRIGHGYALLKHPLVMQRAKERGIAVEVNPISNQVLRLVDDLRNHPASPLLADDFPVVISCDDPCFWNASGLSYDFYETFMGLAGADVDLRFLKQLAINSILYSSLPEDEKSQAMDMWQRKWNQSMGQALDKFRSNAGILTNEVR